MDKYWRIEGGSTNYDTYEKAEDAAKRKLAGSQHDHWDIYAFVARVKSPLPTFEVEKVAN